MSCKLQKLQTNPPFTLGEVTSKSFLVGSETVVSETRLYIPVHNLESTTCKLTKIYYKERVADLVSLISNKKYIARFYKKSSPDIQMHSNPLKEVGNNAPSLDKTIPPIAISPFEALLEYEEKGKIKYVLIKKIKHKGVVSHPSSPFLDKN